MKFYQTARGLRGYQFGPDARDRRLQVQEASIGGDYEDSLDNPGSSALWIGEADTRVEINREQAEQIARLLLSWLAEKRLPEPSP